MVNCQTEVSAKWESINSTHSQICAHDRGYSGQSYKRPAQKQWHITDILKQVRCNILHWLIATELTVAIEDTS